LLVGAENLRHFLHLTQHESFFSIGIYQDIYSGLNPIVGALLIVFCQVMQTELSEDKVLFKRAEGKSIWTSLLFSEMSSKTMSVLSVDSTH